MYRYSYRLRQRHTSRPRGELRAAALELSHRPTDNSALELSYRPIDMSQDHSEVKVRCRILQPVAVNLEYVGPG